VRFALLLLSALSSFAGETITFNDDGGWCWFQDERAIVDHGKLIIGSVASGWRDPDRHGNIEATVFDPATGKLTRVELHHGLLTASRDRQIYDDHNAPAFAVRPDGRLLAIYAKHGDENRFYYRISSDSGDAANWRDEKIFVPSESTHLTYSNVFALRKENRGKGRIYDFYRGLNDSFKPSYAWSDDQGETWKSGSVFIDVPNQFKHRPYAKYTSNGKDTVHIVYTEGHPRNFPNSVYHVYYRKGMLHLSSGKRIRSLSEGLKAPDEGTRVFQGDPENVAWTSDVHLDRNERPYIAYTVHKSSEDHRYRYSRWDGKRWLGQEIAYAGSCLYPAEDHYTGNIALDPDDPNTVYISTNANPVTGQPLVSAADGRRHWEIFHGITSDAGKTWRWDAITQNSTQDNLRPIVPKWDEHNFALLWLRGTYRTYTDYDLSVVGTIGRR
jgi:hypothetical protein